MSWPAVVREWGSTAEERARAYPCDRLVPDPSDSVFRAVDVAAPAETTFRWLCQLRAAPYSYDKLDNWGRRSPQELTPGLERLEAGQVVMSIFRLVEFEPGRSLTVLSRGRLFGGVACTYCADPVDERSSRIVVKAVFGSPRGLHGPLMRVILPPGDLVMMRRQLLNLAELAGRDAPTRSSRSDRRS
ncbi:MAG TPA: hypothetical protein VKA36_00495 [Solirubrobacterales bacterium]|nr:hypothetical protein [Solirubrobacterales bacterium]